MEPSLDYTNHPRYDSYVPGRNAEPLNRGCIVDQLCSLFRRCQAVYEILSALLRSQRYITEFFQLITPVSSGASP